MLLNKDFYFYLFLNYKRGHTKKIQKYYPYKSKGCTSERKKEISVGWVAKGKRSQFRISNDLLLCGASTDLDDNKRELPTARHYYYCRCIFTLGALLISVMRLTTITLCVSVFARHFLRLELDLAHGTSIYWIQLLLNKN